MTMINSKTLDQFISEYGFDISKTTKISKNPYQEDREWQANHYELSLIIRGTDSGAYARDYVTYYSMGIGLKGKPTIKEVLNSLGMECQDAANYSNFEEWADNFGYDTDSRKAEKIFNICNHNAKLIEMWMTPKLYREFIELDFND